MCGSRKGMSGRLHSKLTKDCLSQLSSWLVHHLGAHHTHIPLTSVDFCGCVLIPAQHMDPPSGPTRHPPIPPSHTSQHQSPGVLCALLEWPRSALSSPFWVLL